MPFFFVQPNVIVSNPPQCPDSGGQDLRSDAELLAQARGESGRACYGELVRRHQHWLHRIVRAIVQDSATADDVVQDAFVRAYLALRRCPDVSGFRPWIRVIATRLAFNARRDTASRRRKLQDAAQQPTRKSTPPPNPEAELIILLLTKLKPKEREMLMLRYLEDLSIREIAETLQIGESAVKMRLSRSRAEFARVYEQEQGHE